MTPATAIAMLDGRLAAAGEDIILRRIAPDPVGDSYIAETAPCWAAVRVGKAPGDMVDPEMGDIAVVLSPTGLSSFGTPRLFDLIESQGVTAGVKSVSPIYIGTDLVRVDLVARGGAEILDQQVTIRRAITIVNGLGEKVPNWADLATVWAGQEAISGDAERFVAQEVAATSMCRFCVRWSDLTADLSPKDRLVCADREFGILAVKELGRREGLEITAAARADL